MRKGIFLSLLGVSLAAVDPDILRAKTKQPQPALCGRGHVDMVSKLNQQLMSTPGLQYAPCETFALPDLTALQRVVYAERNPELQSIYETAEDNRRLGAFGDLTADKDQLESLWKQEQSLSEQHPDLASVTRDGKCHEVVMWWVHHLSAERQDQLKLTITLPLLATGGEHREEDVILKAPTEAVQAVMKGYKAATGCSACHASPGAPAPSADCIGAPDGKCPVWPAEFSAPFGLHSTLPPIGNASSYFYYKYLANGTQAQKVSYLEHCFPFVNAHSFFESESCDLYFVGQGSTSPTGIYLSQPKHGIDCCQFYDGIGAVPANFLAAYTYQGTNVSAPDMYGNDVMCDHWEGPESFEYWTVSHWDALYKIWGADIVFKDGPTGVTWRWGNFNVEPQDDSLFALPGTTEKCAESCSVFLSAEEHEAMAKHLHTFSLSSMSR